MAGFGGPPIGPDLFAGLETISGGQTIEFTLYKRVVLPLDGFAFWVKADLLTDSAIYNLSEYCTAINNDPGYVTPAHTFTASGSLHIAAQKIQEETETYGTNKIIFTSEEPVNQNFNQILDGLMYVGEFRGQKFAFSVRQNFYQQADIWHYIGDAVYPFMQSQMIESLEQLDTMSLVVSNSLPIWLYLNNYTPDLPAYGIGNTYLPLYPSHLVDSNANPPFAAVHIIPDSTEAIASVPKLGKRMQHDQLARERVKITMFGLRNNYALDFVDCVLQYCQDYQYFGLMNCPIIRDEKMSQNELNIIAMKKSVEFEISYHQSRVRDIARQIIGRAIVGYVIKPQTYTDVQVSAYPYPPVLY